MFSMSVTWNILCMLCKIWLNPHPTPPHQTNIQLSMSKGSKNWGFRLEKYNTYRLYTNNYKLFILSKYSKFWQMYEWFSVLCDILLPTWAISSWNSWNRQMVLEQHCGSIILINFWLLCWLGYLSYFVSKWLWKNLALYSPTGN